MRITFLSVFLLLVCWVLDASGNGDWFSEARDCHLRDPLRWEWDLRAHECRLRCHLVTNASGPECSGRCAPDAGGNTCVSRVADPHSLRRCACETQRWRCGLPTDLGNECAMYPAPNNATTHNYCCAPLKSRITSFPLGYIDACANISACASARVAFQRASSAPDAGLVLSRACVDQCTSDPRCLINSKARDPLIDALGQPFGIKQSVWDSPCVPKDSCSALGASKRLCAKVSFCAWQPLSKPGRRCVPVSDVRAAWLKVLSDSATRTVRIRRNIDGSWLVAAFVMIIAASGLLIWSVAGTDPRELNDAHSSFKSHAAADGTTVVTKLGVKHFSDATQFAVAVHEAASAAAIATRKYV